jgi:ribosome-associated translation inhibitor RaiA
MRIQVLGEDTISAQTRIYAEYRLFAALTRRADADQIRHAHVVLRHVNDARDRERVSCAVTVGFDGTADVRVRATGNHAYAAINRAADRVRTATLLHFGTACRT